MPNEHPSYKVVEHFQGSSPLLDFNLFHSFVESLSRLGGLKQMGLIGVGEPTLHPDLSRMISTSKYLIPDCCIEVFTNGLLLREIGDDLVSAGLDTISISINAFDEQSYEQMNPSGGSHAFKTIVDGIRYIRCKYSDLNIRLGIVICQSSAYPLEIHKFARNIGANSVRYSPLIPPPGWENKMSAFALSSSHLSQFIKSIKKLRRDNLDNDIQPLSYDDETQLLSLMDDNGLISTSNYYQTNPCFIGELYSVLTSDGDIKGCGQSMRVLGNLHKEDFISIWNSSDYYNFRADCHNISNSGGFVRDCFCDKCTYVILNKNAADYHI